MPDKSDANANEKIFFLQVDDLTVSNGKETRLKIGEFVYYRHDTATGQIFHSYSDFRHKKCHMRLTIVLLFPSTCQLVCGWSAVAFRCFTSKYQHNFGNDVLKN